ELRHIPLRDDSGAAHIGRDRGRADLGAFADRADAERRLVAQAGLGHVHVALLEDPQRQPAPREEDGGEWKKRQLVYGAPSPASARWRTSTRQSARNAFASSSARYTERWRPPVQPMATVTWLRCSRTISGSQCLSRRGTSSSQRCTEASRARYSITG